jgi:hypothetical protein
VYKNRDENGMQRVTKCRDARVGIFNRKQNQADSSNREPRAPGGGHPAYNAVSALLAPNTLAQKSALLMKPAVVTKKKPGAQSVTTPNKIGSPP